MDYEKYFPIREYYTKYVRPKNPSRYRNNSEKLVCPVHDDHNPSLGIVHSKSDGELCHCFGCNFWGNVVQLHQAVVKRLEKRYISEEKSLKELCSIFSIDYDSLPKDLEQRTSIDKGLHQEVELDKSISKFDIGDFKQLLVEGKRQKKGIGYYNALVMMLLSEVKEDD